jgi:D-sedoheptulose 7-phosphate isomerase
VSDADRVRQALIGAAALHQQVADSGAAAVVKAAELCRKALGSGGQLLVFGNGGSATDAQHFAAELVGRFTKERPGLAAVALTADSAVLTSVANDYGFQAVFARQVEALGGAGDVAIGLTTSGRSANVNAAFARARELGLGTVALTGRDGGATASLVDVHVNVPGGDTARIQEVHRTLLHILCELIEN